MVLGVPRLPEHEQVHPPHPHRYPRRMNGIHAFAAIAVLGLLAATLSAHPPLADGHELHDEPWLAIEKLSQPDKFRQLEEILPTPNAFRTASGAPGPEYWQNRADHRIEVRLDDEGHRIEGFEEVVYSNESPDTLTYLWMQLEPNRYAKGSQALLSDSGPDLRQEQGVGFLRELEANRNWTGGVTIESVDDAAGDPLPHTIVGTMMRIDLPKPLGPGQTIEFSIRWHHPMREKRQGRGRSLYEWFPEDGNALYLVSKWFPRMCAYTDATGWQHKQFLGRGEFTLEFGDYEVAIDVPETYVVAATGELENADEVLTVAQRERLAQARDADRPIHVVSPEEALANEARDRELRDAGTRGRRTWRFAAENVRDFAWAASPKFIWDAFGVAVPGRDDPESGERSTMCMSFWPSAAEPLWSQYSTQSVAHGIEVYSDVAYPYPYPTAISVNGPVGGMEYPMITFNGPRPEKDGTWSEGTQKGLVKVIIHEVGHFWFPMIINSDERQWTWMDEGLNTFVQRLAERRWDERWTRGRGEPQAIVPFMISEDQRPIMTNSESVIQFGNNAYAKPAAALNILRETVMGRELFDFAFREYCRRWAFKRPMPADFFRTMEDASGVDLDWFWRGWFYSTEHVDVGIEKVTAFRLVTEDPDLDKPFREADRDGRPPSVSVQRDAGIERRTERFPELEDFYDRFDELDVTPEDRRAYRRWLDSMPEADRELWSAPEFFTVIRFRNHGGVVMPLPLLVGYEDGSEELVRLPAEIWKQDHEAVSKLFVTAKRPVAFRLDPFGEIADADRTNNRYPSEIVGATFSVRADTGRGENPMRRALTEEYVGPTEAKARAAAAALIEAWTRDAAQAVIAPASSRDAILAAIADARVLADAADKPFEIEFGEDPAIVDRPGEVVFVVLRAAGPDGLHGTRDDRAFSFRGDGSMGEAKASR